MTVFICYSREDKQSAEMLAADIDALGKDVWIDQELGGGQSWWEQILQGIRETDLFVFVLARGALDSVACRREYNYAADLGKPILPVLVANGVSTNLLPPPLAAIQFVDYRHRDADTSLRLAHAIGTVPAPKPLPDPLPDPPQVPLSYLGGLRQQIESTDTLGFSEQSALLVDLKRSLRDPETSEDGRELLRIFAGRRDLLAMIAREIDSLFSDTMVTPQPHPDPEPPQFEKPHHIVGPSPAPTDHKPAGAVQGGIRGALVGSVAGAVFSSVSSVMLWGGVNVYAVIETTVVFGVAGAGAATISGNRSFVIWTALGGFIIGWLASSIFYVSQGAPIFHAMLHRYVLFVAALGGILGAVVGAWIDRKRPPLV